MKLVYNILVFQIILFNNSRSSITQKNPENSTSCFFAYIIYTKSDYLLFIYHLLITQSQNVKIYILDISSYRPFFLPQILLGT